MHYQVPKPECVDVDWADAFGNGLDHKSLNVCTKSINSERLRKLSCFLFYPRQLPDRYAESLRTVSSQRTPESHSYTPTALKMFSFCAPLALRP